MTENNAINFLLYSYFELTLDDKEPAILDAAMERAYRDASGRVLSIAEELGGNEAYKGEAKEKLRSQITELSKLTTPVDYEKWLYATCEILLKAYTSAKDKNEDTAFYFGHAQKWVNMTMKYLYVIKTIFKKYDKDVPSWLTLDLEKQLHIPVDSYIMEAATKKKVNFSYGLNIQLPGKSKELAPYSSAKSWSKWEEDEYRTFRTELKGKISEDSPLDWEGPAWIEIAKHRKAKEKNKKEKNT